MCGTYMCICTVGEVHTYIICAHVNWVYMCILDVYMCILGKAHICVYVYTRWRSYMCICILNEAAAGLGFSQKYLCNIYYISDPTSI